jgi:hypothetical protein
MDSETLEDPIVKEGLGGMTAAVKRTSLMRTWFSDHIKRSQNKVISERITVTPELAAIILEKNNENRKLRPNKLNQLKNDMNNHRFKFNGEAIIIAKTGELNDGQHRLTAIIETNRPQDMLVTFGVERDSRFTVDTGAARSAGDHLSLSGWPYANTIASVARMALAYERRKGVDLGRGSDISTSEVMARANRDNLLAECASNIAQHAPKYRQFGGIGVVGFMYYLFASKRPKEAKNFIEKVRTGADLPEASPIRLLREKLISSPRFTKTQVVEAYIRSWNAWITNKPIKQIKVLSNGLPQVEG